ncbi:pyridoxamine 5'-phosphate oxidase [Nocardia sp. CA-128927]|uniref:pyridoxamine 5'-phosphate oxidase n=1 Tax=Nocardia sp. CA-128927 TaxID=3239975 RepID=UPI003D97FC7A
MTDIADFARLIAGDHGLCVVSTSRADGTVQSTLVNAGVLAHPQTGESVVGMVIRGGTRKLDNLRVRARMTVVARVGWAWAAVEGAVWIVGPDDQVPGIDAERLRQLLREVFTAAGGTHDDWDEYDRVMAADRRAVVLVVPDRIYGNG